MDARKRAAEIRADLTKLAGRRGRGKAYPAELRRKALSYIGSRLEEGGSVYAVAREIGISQTSLARWIESEPQRASAAFRPVTVVADDGPAPGAIVVHGPAGIRVEGLDMAGVAELLRRLG